MRRHSPARRTKQMIFDDRFSGTSLDTTKSTNSLGVRATVRNDNSDTWRVGQLGTAVPVASRSTATSAWSRHVTGSARTMRPGWTRPSAQPRRLPETPAAVQRSVLPPRRALASPCATARAQGPHSTTLQRSLQRRYWACRTARPARTRPPRSRSCWMPSCRSTRACSPWTGSGSPAGTFQARPGSPGWRPARRC